MERLKHLDHFYELLKDLEDRLGGRRILGECHGRMGWPGRGVYFFFEPGEFREDGRNPRVVRVGTHALKRGSKSTLWGRLRQHRGNIGGKRPGGGDHRGSVFRHHVGSSILCKEGLEDRYPTWGVGSSAKKTVRIKEYPIERLVSQHICSMPFIWLGVNDEPGPESVRGYIERNAIGLLSNHSRLGTAEAIDPPSRNWVGAFSPNEKVRSSGLWNSNHTEEVYHPGFLETLENHIKRM